MDTRIYCITHKEFTPPAMDGYIPLHVGSALSDSLEYMSDDTGDNISHKNKSYCELTGIYWIWKNIQCDIVGICHYRRYFIKDNQILSKEYIENTLADYDVIVSNSGQTEKANVKEHYADMHHLSDLEICRNVLCEMYPEYIDAFDLTMNCNLMTLGNMIITKKEYFDNYCEWLFPLLKEVEKRTDISHYDVFQARLYGYLAERLLRVWLLCQNYKIREEEVKLVSPEQLIDSNNLSAIKSRYVELLLDEFIKQYENGTPVDIYPCKKHNVDFNNKIPTFSYWWPGLDNMPKLVSKCLNSIDQNLPNEITEFHLITLDNIFNYIDLPDTIIKKFNNGKISPNQLAEILHMSLLYCYGGLWIDPSYYATSSIDNAIFSQPFWTIKNMVHTNWNPFFVYMQPNSVLARFILNGLYAYWSTENSFIDDNIINTLFDIAYRRIPTVKTDVDKIKFSNPNESTLMEIINKKYNPAKWCDITNTTNLFKFNYENKFISQNIVGEHTFYGKIFD